MNPAMSKPLETRNPLDCLIPFLIGFLAGAVGMIFILIP